MFFTFLIFAQYNQTNNHAIKCQVSNAVFPMQPTGFHWIVCFSM